MIHSLFSGTFIGRSSLGYVQGQEYKLRGWWDRHWLWVEPLDKSAEKCPYNSMWALLNNWLIEAETVGVVSDSRTEETK